MTAFLELEVCPSYSSPLITDILDLMELRHQLVARSSRAQRSAVDLLGLLQF